VTFTELARRFPTMRRILAINRRRHLNKEWHEKGSTGMEPSKDMVSQFSIEELGWNF
jgi:hypothetical protein